MTAPLAFTFSDWLPHRASSLAPRVDGAFGVLLVFSVVLVGALGVANLYFLVRYRRGSNAPRPPVRVSTAKIETGWIAATTLAFLGFFFMGARVYLDEERPPMGGTEIHVTGRQWMWDVRHANGRREFDELHVPVDEDIRLVMSSEDVIHSFFVPAFRLKQDVVPGKEVTMWFHPTKPGRYRFFCAEFCGTKHSGMTGEVVVLPAADYVRWLALGNPATELAVRGRQLFMRYNCSGCHDQPAAVRAPTLDGVYGALVPLREGRFVRADDAYLRDSILQPAKDVVAGYEPVMPSYQGVIPENDLLDLLAYVKQLATRTDDRAGDVRPAAP